MAANVTATYAIELKDQISGPAADAASQLTQLKAKIDQDTKALGEMQAAMRRLQGGAAVNIEQFKQLKAAIAAKKSAIGDAQSQYLALGGTFGAVAKKTEIATATQSSFLNEMREAPGVLGFVGKAASKNFFLLGTGISVLLGLGAAAVAATVAFFSFAFASAAARTEEEARIGTAIKSQKAAGALQASIDRISDISAAPRAEIEKLAVQLHRSGLRGDELNRRLKLKAEVIGLSKLNQPAAALDKIKERVRSIFSGVNIRPIVDLMREVANSLSQTTSTGRGLKSLVTGLFDPISRSVKAAIPGVKNFFREFTIIALKIGIEYQLLRIKLTSAFRDISAQMGLSVEAADVAHAMFAALGGVVFTLGLVVAAIAAPFVALIAVIKGAYEVGVVFGEFLNDLVAIGGELGKELYDSFTVIGESIVDGLVGGIQRQIAKVREAITYVATEAKGALTEALGIASPSKVFAEYGRFTAQGYASGVESGAPRAVEAIGSLAVEPATDSKRGAMASTAVSIGPIYVTASGDTAREWAESFREELAKVFEGVGLQMGAR